MSCGRSSVRRLTCALSQAEQNIASTKAALSCDRANLGDGYAGHHVNNVKDYPNLAVEADNIKFVKRKGEHLAEHGGNFRNTTSGPLIDRKKMIEEHQSSKKTE